MQAEAFHLRLRPAVTKDDRNGWQPHLARGFHAQMSVYNFDFVPAMTPQNRDRHPIFFDCGHHPVHCMIVLAQNAWGGNQLIDSNFKNFHFVTYSSEVVSTLLSRPRTSLLVPSDRIEFIDPLTRSRPAEI